MSRRGFTLVEILVGAAIGAVVVLVASRQLITASRYSNRMTGSLELETARTTIGREVEHLLTRARAVAGTQVGAPTAGYLVYGQGAIAFRSDLRPCAPPGGWNANYFRPGDPALGVYTLAAFICCDRALNVTVNDPFGGAVAMTSACTTRPGLSLEYRRGATVNRRCFEFGPTGIGFTGLRLAQVGANIASARPGMFVAAPDPDDPPLVNIPPTAASPVGYMAFVSRDRIFSGEAQNENAPVAGPSGTGETQSHLEIYGSPSNRPGSRQRIFPCGRGVQDQ